MAQVFATNSLTMHHGGSTMSWRELGCVAQLKRPHSFIIVCACVTLHIFNKTTLRHQCLDDMVFAVHALLGQRIPAPQAVHYYYA